MVNLEEEKRALALYDAIAIAKSECWDSVDNLEEHGGVIMYNPATVQYKFVKLNNKNSGKTIALGLWTADQKEYAEKIIPIFRQGWTQFASFHTHPQFKATPSSIDLTELFPGFPVNFIYSPVEKATKQFTWFREEEEFINTVIIWDRVDMRHKPGADKVKEENE